MSFLYYVYGVAVGIGMLLLWSRHREVVAWNGGRCRCGLPWTQYDTDSQGGRMYKCPSGKHGGCVISWGVDRPSRRDR